MQIRVGAVLVDSLTGAIAVPYDRLESNYAEHRDGTRATPRIAVA